ncbi:MAG: phosphoribosylpyrophosphate synthetase [Bacteroidota bacterium]|nr:phosphoribosylpyrophosphate synthetase [Bacteroidota bacterium]MDP3145665.1 phosphoribosylpyrophosphate synthetase [Bacteroidota bacterium]MDP3558661.1 phosphoribosylpyrophosphate synthetase [Bacteroidota bacterium]
MIIPINDSTLSMVLNQLKKKGYENDMLELIKQTGNPKKFKIVEVYRFEGMSNPSDNSILYAIKSSSGEKGIVIDSYGANADSIKTELLSKIEFERK